VSGGTTAPDHVATCPDMLSTSFPALATRQARMQRLRAPTVAGGDTPILR
jgi:hypothetical protein